jgi:DNA mismatch repair protein MSH2
LEKLQEMVETTIDLEAIADHEFIIKADFDEDLLGICTIYLFTY